MTNILRKGLVFVKLLVGAGDMIRAGKAIDQIFRFYVLETMDNEGLFDYLKTDRSYGEILAKFGFVDSPYTRLVFDTIAEDKQNLLIKVDGVYRRNSEVPVPSIEKVMAGTPGNLRNFNMMAKGMAVYVAQRIRNQPTELSSNFEADGRQLMSKFDKTLSMRAYSAAREANFSFLTRDEQRSLFGKKLLEVGCGTGRETAEIWLRWKGDIHIIGIDPVESMLDLARAEFANYLDGMQPDHAPLTDANRPVFEQHSATKLPYPDNSFDAVYTGFVLHWTPDPAKAIAEIARVLKPGGIALGAQPIKPLANAYFDLVIRANENVHGYFWVEELKRWFKDHRIEIEVATPLVLYKGVKPI